MALGVFAVLLLERLDNGFRTAAQIERMFNCNALGMVPRRQRKQGHRLSNLVVQETNTPYVEAIRHKVKNLDVNYIRAEGRTPLDGLDDLFSLAEMPM